MGRVSKYFEIFRFFPRQSYLPHPLTATRLPCQFSLKFPPRLLNRVLLSAPKKKQPASHRLLRILFLFTACPYPAW